jgi:hypothetical protein
MAIHSHFWMSEYDAESRERGGNLCSLQLTFCLHISNTLLCTRDQSVLSTVEIFYCLQSLSKDNFVFFIYYK